MVNEDPDWTIVFPLKTIVIVKPTLSDELTVKPEV